jgi:hypothetical protein
MRILRTDRDGLLCARLVLAGNELLEGGVINSRIKYSTVKIRIGIGDERDRLPRLP